MKTALLLMACMLGCSAAAAWAGDGPLPATIVGPVVADASDAAGTLADDESAAYHGAVYQGPEELVMNDEAADEAATPAATDDASDAQASPGADKAVQARVLQKFIALTGDKIVVILPKGWGGSVPDLLAALKDASDDAEIVVLAHKGEQAEPAPPVAPDADDDDDDEEEEGDDD